MNNLPASLWRSELVRIDGPSFHFVPCSSLDIELLKQAAHEINFALFVVDADHIQSENDLMVALSEAMTFPEYFGGNWNAVLDCLQDLSWTVADGYTLLFNGGDSLPTLPDETFSSLISVLEASVRSWRDEFGEFGDRNCSTAFHVIFSGGETLRVALLEELREPLREELGGGSAVTFPAPVRLRTTPLYKQAESLVSAGAGSEAVLSLLRQSGMTERDSMYSAAGLMGLSIRDAKTLISTSQTWSETRNSDDRFREVAKSALRNFEQT